MSLRDLLAFFLGEALIWLMVWPIFYEVYKKKYFFLIRIVMSVFLAWVIVKVVKITFPVERPFEALNIPLIPLTSHGMQDSFPSAHAAIAFAMGGSYWLFQHKLGSIMLGLAVLVAIGRVMLFVHYPIDVLVGAGIGIIVSFGVAQLTSLPKDNQKI